MRDRAFADFMVGALACVSVFGLYAVVRESEFLRERERRLAATRWRLPGSARARSPENGCRHCGGGGHCDSCGPACRVCRGSGVQPRDRALVTRLDALWDGVR